MAKRNYNDWTKEDLIKEVEALKKQKTYGLVWEQDKTREVFDYYINWDEAKTKEIFKDSENKFPVLTEIKDNEILIDKDINTNLLIEGDNYHSLTTLNFTHNKAVDVIYIDPPYNTGQEDFKYNDKYVNREDSYKHSKWLSFMSKRLKLAKNLLKLDGVIFISIDENELAQLKLLCDEIFNNRLCGIFVWQKKYGGGNDSGQIATEHEYILCYSKNELIKEWLEPHSEEYLKRYKEIDEKGRFFWDTLERPGLRNPITVKINYGGKDYQLKTFRGQNRVDEELQNGEIRVVALSNKLSFQFKQRLREGKKPRSILRDSQKEQDSDSENAYLRIGSNSSAKQELRNFFGKDIFENPKPSSLIRYLLTITGIQNGIILDFFAGSGTTAQATLELNKQDGGNRTFILCTNNEQGICTEVCYPRIQKVIRGYTSSDGKVINGLNGNLRYYKTCFVNSSTTDTNKKNIVDKSTEMLCIKENAFNQVVEKEGYKIYKGSTNYLGIVFNDESIEDFVNIVMSIDGIFNVYVFSLDDTVPIEEFKSIKDKVNLCPIPEVILHIYRRIYKND